MYQHLVNESSVLADNQCLTVNPLIIERKNTYLKSMQAIKDDDQEEYKKLTDHYFTISSRFVVAQKNWLVDDKAFMDKWEFKHFTPKYVQDAAKYQYTSFQADAESTELLTESYQISQLNTSLSEEIAFKASDKIKIRNDAEKKYNDVWDNPGKLDWRTRFIRVPPTKCSDDNSNFPNTDLKDIFEPSPPDSPLT